MHTSSKWLVTAFAAAVVFVLPAAGCGKPQVKCTPSSCFGCCDATTGECATGASQVACGSGGQVCMSCSLGTICQLGLCSGNGGGNGGGSTGGGTGGGTTGGGTGGGTTGGGTGGGGACTGCLFQGTCIDRANSNNNSICGQGGGACASCAAGLQTCVNWVCTGSTGGGTGGGTTGGGTGGGGATGGGVGGGGGVTGGGTGGGGASVGESCATPTALSFTGTVSGSTLNATNDVSLTCESGSAGDLVYSFTTTSTKQLTATLNAASFQAALGLMTLSAGSCTSQLLCRAALSAGASTTIDTWVQAGTYAMVIDSAGTTGGSYTLSATLTNPPSPTVLSNNGLLTVAGVQDSYRMYAITLPAAAASLTISISGGTGDADIYGALGTPPTRTVYDYASEAGGNTDTVSWVPASAGTYYLLVWGYRDYSGVTLTASYF